VCTEYSIYNGYLGDTLIVSVTFTPCCGEKNLSPYGLYQKATVSLCSSTYPVVPNELVTVTTIRPCPSCV
jgi:hypothetical protein